MTSRAKIAGGGPGGSRTRELKGIGMSLFLHGCAFTGSGGKDKIRVGVKLRKRADGRVEILVSSAEFGQGPSTTLRKIVAGDLGIPMSAVVFDNPDTDRVPDSGPTVASRTVLIVGKLLERAARALKDALERGGGDRPSHLRDRGEGDVGGVRRWKGDLTSGSSEGRSREVSPRGSDGGR